MPKRNLLNQVYEYLAFLDYSILETTCKNIEETLSEREGDTTFTAERFCEFRCYILPIRTVMKLITEVQDLKKQSLVKDSEIIIGLSLHHHVTTFHIL